MGGVPPVQGLHLTFGRDPSRQMVASWLTDGHVQQAARRLRLVRRRLRLQSAQAETRTYVDGASGRTVYVHHALIKSACGRTPTTCTRCSTKVRDARTPGRSGPRRAGRAPFTFTSFGDQSAPQVTWDANGVSALDANSTPATKDIVAGHRDHRPAVPPDERRPLLRQPRRRPRPHLEQFLHQQHALGPLPTMDAGRREP